jgi:hypothetical protein
MRWQFGALHHSLEDVNVLIRGCIAFEKDGLLVGITNDRQTGR